MRQVFWTVKDLGKVWDKEEWERGVGLGWNRERVGKGKDEARKLSLF